MRNFKEYKGLNWRLMYSPITKRFDWIMEDPVMGSDEPAEQQLTPLNGEPGTECAETKPKK